MNEVLKRVEEAIRDALIKEMGQIVVWHEPFLARAAIEAMREPTFDMKMAGAAAITSEIMKANANYDGASDCWSAMIDAALSDTPSITPESAAPKADAQPLPPETPNAD